MSERLLDNLNAVIEGAIASGDLAYVQAAGPERLVNALIATYPDEEITAELIANRAEAERIVAGVLGLC